MLDTSLLLLLKALLINIIIPLVPGLLLIMVLFRDKFQGMILYILSWFLGVGIISHRMFDLQFIHFGIGIKEYCLLIFILALGIYLRLWQKTLTRSQIKQSLKITKTEHIKESFIQSSRIEKILTLASLFFISWFLINSFIHTISFPTFADDSFGNRHKPAVNIMYDGGVKMFGSTGEILGRARLGYPIHIPIYKAVIGKFMGGRYDTYVNLFQWLGFLAIILLGYIITFAKTKNIFLSIVPGALICSLPLVFRHVIDGYHELPSFYYSIITIYLFYEFFDSGDIEYISLGTIMLRVLAYIKNDGFVIYVPAIIISFVITIAMKGTYKAIRKQCIKSKKFILTNLISITTILLPFFLLKQYYGLGFNQAQGAESGIGLSNKIHREIFSQFKLIFFQENNYNVILLIFILTGYIIYKLNIKKQNRNKNFLVLTPIITFLIFTFVFLLTENYKFVMNQTTVNRTYTVCFIMMLFFTGLLIHDYTKEISIQKLSK